MDDRERNKTADREEEYEKVCYVCRRPESKAGKMISMPGGIDVCPNCMQRAFDMVSTSGLDLSKLSGVTPEMLWNGGLMAGFGKAPGKGKGPGAGKTKEESEKKGLTAGQKSEDTAGLGREEAKAAGDSARIGGTEAKEAGDSAGFGGAEAKETGDSAGSGGAETKGTERFAAGSHEDSPSEEVVEETQKEDEGPEEGTSYQGAFPWGNMGFGIPIGQIDLNAITGKRRVKKKSGDGKKKELFKLSEIPAPHTIKERLDEYVIGQEKAKKVISVAVYNHYKRVFERTSPDAEKYGKDIEIEKSNILMIGPTGSGKTYLVKTLAKLLNVPLAIADATSLTEAGYIGDDIESVISKLLAAADNDVEKAEMGIVFIDEIDKIAKKKSASTRDVSGESVQQELLKLLEGASVEVPVGTNQKNAMTPMETVSTENILFICGGAFPDLENIIKERLTKQSSIGFGAELKDRFDKDPEILSKVTNEDLRSFGMIPEFLGRLPVTVTLSGLTQEFLVRILKEPKNAILKQYQKLLEMDEVKLTFDDDALEWIAGEAMKKETGARALRAIIEEFMLDIMYEIPKDPNIGEVTITRAYLEKRGGPRIAVRTAPMLTDASQA